MEVNYNYLEVWRQSLLSLYSELFMQLNSEDPDVNNAQSVSKV